MASQQLNIWVTTPDEKIMEFTLDANEPVEHLKALLEVETGIVVKEQQLVFDARELPDQKKLSECGVTTGSMLFVAKREPARGGGGGGSAGGGGGQQPMDAAQVQQYFRTNPDALTQLLHNNPTMAEAVLSDDLTALSNLLAEQAQRRRQAELEQARRIQQLNDDPFNLEAQRAIEEEIMKDNIRENMEAALEYNPEAFGRVVMLYIDCEVNKTPLKAFVDSGAQMTIISLEAAQKCGLSRLIDNRWSGIAKGVGTAKIVGRIHVAPLKIGNSFFSSSFTVLENNGGVDLLLGLDMLRKHQCVIDLRETALRIGEEVVPFLSEKDIPRSELFDSEHAEPRSPAPPSPLPSLVPLPAAGAAPRPAAAQVPTLIPGGQPVPSPVAAGPTPAGAAFPEASVQNLVTSLGVTREEAVAALRAYGGNVDMAASALLQSRFGF